MGINDDKLIEVVSSPMSNLTGINNLTADKTKTTLKRFSELNAINIPNLKQKFASHTVQYNKDYNIQTKKSFLSSAYWKERTREHFMIVSFHKNTASASMSM